ncbi:hypothetical protein J2S43_006722 [Catenuloplanes nepalensis]|uniref:DUF4232 domain-containing protein n=1 Tax=Catenuloplanes nepalensis TaxID=587533 RepID=A0ABT9N3T5_9ACTN|nr:hypothetical protein [Catenuloplanes nepalensis]MDP9798210.1 hypothetical protein [Catenuloplanes nepalensis]
MTVGPHPPAVYWRRRAVVIGALLVVIMVIVYSCTRGGGTDTPTGQGTGTPSPNADATPTSTASPAVLTPRTDPPGQSQSFNPAPEGGSAGLPQPEDSLFPTAGADGIVVGGNGGCAQGAITISAATDRASVARGAGLQFELKIKNGSGQACTLDVGSREQEMYLKRGAETIWSSDTCADPGVSDMRTFAPGEETTIGTAGWNGKSSAKCSNGSAAGDAPTAGTYQLFGRLSQQTTNPITITLS